jgi:predicted flap endonuclease-1-like 5' DNA nuclease
MKMTLTRLAALLLVVLLLASLPLAALAQEATPAAEHSTEETHAEATAEHSEEEATHSETAADAEHSEEADVEMTEGEAAEAPGATTLMLLIGIGAILAVGLFTGVRQSFKPTDETK